MADKIGEKRENRQPNGTFGPGNLANPNGRPTFSLVSILKEQLQEVPEGEKETQAQLLIKRMIKSAIKNGNDQQIKNILQYIEGLPKQSVDLNGDLTYRLIRGDDS